MPRGKRRGGGRGRPGCSKIKPVIRSAKQIEDGISSTPTVKWDPFSVLPKEIYLEIFNKLDNPTDKQNFMNAHVKFYDLFKAERVKFLFGKVFGDLLVLDEKMTWFPNWRDERIWKAKKKSNRLRLVCRDWDQSIQNYYQLHPDYSQFVFCEEKWTKNSKQLRNEYPDGYFIDQLEWSYRDVAMRLETDLDEFRQSHPPSRNPFLTRKVKIQLDITGRSDDEELRRLRSQIHTLLKTYGQHIWYFSFHHRADFDNGSLNPEMYLEIVKWLKLMPELKALHLEFQCYYDCKQMRETNELIKNLQIELPEMSTLQCFHVSGFPPSAFNKFLEGMKAVEKVEVADPPHLLTEFKFPTSLTEVALKIFRDVDMIHLNSLQQFPLVRNLIIDLEWCPLELDHFQGTHSWNTVWMAVEEKFPAVEDLHLSLPRAFTDINKFRLMEQSLDCRLNLKKLKRLSLTFESLSSLDFVQEIKTLQELKVELISFTHRVFKGSDDLLRRETVQVNRHLATMWESNIWQVFPNLRKLSIREQTGGIHHVYEKGAKGQQICN